MDNTFKIVTVLKDIPIICTSNTIYEQQPIYLTANTGEQNNG